MSEAMRETRDLTIARHVRTALDNSALNEDAYADQVRRIYQQRTPEHLRRVEFHNHTPGADPYKVLRANAQIVRRMLDGATVRLAAEVEEALVLALPEPFQRQCLVDLSARYGLMAVERPAENVPGAIDQLGRLAANFGSCLQALAATIGDGHLSQCDVPGAHTAISELDELISRATTLRAAHLQLLRQFGRADAGKAGGSAWHIGPPEPCGVPADSKL